MAKGLDAIRETFISRVRISLRGAVLFAIERGARGTDSAPGNSLGVRTAAASWPDPCRRGGAGHYGKAGACSGAGSGGWRDQVPIAADFTNGIRVKASVFPFVTVRLAEVGEKRRSEGTASFGLMSLINQVIWEESDESRQAIANHKVDGLAGL